jgi:hypothetical protein
MGRRFLGLPLRPAIPVAAPAVAPPVVELQDRVDAVELRLRSFLDGQAAHWPEDRNQEAIDLALDVAGALGIALAAPRAPSVPVVPGAVVVIEQSIRANQHGEPVMTIRITGGNEIFRFAFYMAQGPVDHLSYAMRAFRYLRRRWGSAVFKRHDNVITGGRVVKWGYHLDSGRDS